jgi:hypothetical protein
MAHRHAERLTTGRHAPVSAARLRRRGNRWWWVMTLGLMIGLLLYLFQRF